MTDWDNPTADVALLTPVPEEHLRSAINAFGNEAEVVYGTDAGMALSEFSHAVGQTHTADVLIYASESSRSGPPVISYRARFADFRGAEQGSAPGDWGLLRPPSTATDGAFLGFYRVIGLHELDEPIVISTLTKRDNKTKLAKNFVPLGPTIIENPF